MTTNGLIGGLISQADFDIPVLDTTALHVDAALDFLTKSQSVAA